MSPLILGKSISATFYQFLLYIPGPACVPSYTIRDVWPPDYEEKMMRHFTIPRDAVIEVEEPDEETPEDDISASIVTVKEAATYSTETQTEDIPEMLEGSLLVTCSVDSLEEDTVVTELRSRNNSLISGQFLKPPRVANSLECLRQLSQRRSSLIDFKQKTF